jgi:hypothetical protein
MGAAMVAGHGRGSAVPGRKVLVQSGAACGTAHTCGEGFPAESPGNRRCAAATSRRSASYACSRTCAAGEGREGGQCAAAAGGGRCQARPGAAGSTAGHAFPRTARHRRAPVRAAAAPLLPPAASSSAPAASRSPQAQLPKPSPTNPAPSPASPAKPIQAHLLVEVARHALQHVHRLLVVRQEGRPCVLQVQAQHLQGWVVGLGLGWVGWGASR